MKKIIALIMLFALALSLCACVVTGASGEGDNRVNSKLFCKENGVTEILVIFCGDLRVGMYGVSVASERADFNVVLFEGSNEFVIFFLVCKKLCGVAMSLSGVSARADLYGVNAKSRNDSERLVKRLLCI